VTLRAAAAAIALGACGSSGDAGSDAAVCTHTPGAPIAVGAITGAATSELSGLAASRTLDGVLWTHGDGGDAVIYAINASNAAVRGTLRLPGAHAVDWEDIATAPCPAGTCIYIADTGDNELDRTEVAVFEIAEPAAAPIGAVDTAFTAYAVAYPDGPHNIEALFVDPRDGTAYGIVKLAAARTSVWALPRVAGAVATAVHVGELTIPSADPRVTAADMAVDACAARILVRSHDALYELRGAAAATVPELLTAGLATLPVASEPQGEAAGYAVDGSAYFTTSEGAAPPLYRVAD